MKSYFSLLMFLLFTSVSLGQTLNLEKASPFTAVKWTDEDQPMVKFKDEWFTLVKLDNHTTKELLDFCKKEFDDKWQKRFSEDLIEVLTKMGTPPSQKVALVLEKDSNQIQVTGTYSLENRQKVYLYNQERRKRKALKNMTYSQAVEDIDQFYGILQGKSSYIHLTDYDMKTAIDSLKARIISTSMDSVGINYLTHELAKIMAEIGDRHSSVKNEWFERKNHATHNLQLPFSMAPLNNKTIALRATEVDGNYEYLHGDFPFVRSINGIPMEVFIDSMAFRSRKAPKQAKLSRGLLEVQQLGDLYFKNNLEPPAKIETVFTNGQTDITETINLVNTPLGYESHIERNIHHNGMDIAKGNFQGIFKLLKGDIGYFSIPQMFSFDDVPGLEAHLDSVLGNLPNTKALIVDLRFNPGGTRDLIQKFAGHIIPESHSPWVANVAYLRTNKRETVHSSMSNRLLYTYDSNHFDDLDRKAIDEFSKSFATERGFDSSKFSQPHYMVLKSGAPDYKHPIYILVNEHSFSAASVFASAFKGLPNVNIVGVTTDGSSGNSKRIHLKNSNIRLRVSTMLSFQRNGKTLDGNGTEPDIPLPKKTEQVLKGTDVQLQQLMEAINGM
tara:strand:- start:13854 stop:15692 length:1839 start_codon:yes stop_codon:yes gene_type:complete